MVDAERSVVAPVEVARDLTLGDLRAALSAGIGDFLKCPVFGLFFASIYVAVGIFLYYSLVTYGETLWLIPAAAGFPLVAPFTAIGLYEVSRRRSAGLPRSWRAVLEALRGGGDDQPLMMGGILFVAFSFWMILAHGIFAIFMAESGIGMSSVDMLLSPMGLLMLAVGSVVGALTALLFYAITVMSLPMLVDRDVDFLTAIIVSLAVIRSNTFVMLTWALIIAIALFAAMLPLFLGLLVALPILGHATWHLYVRAVGQENLQEVERN